jgi:hypothetical protein
MSTNKKSFLLHIDSLDILDDLTNGQAGVLFKAIKAYQHNDDFPLDSIVKIAFSPFKNQFLRDDDKYIKTCERRAIAGSKGGKQKVANASKCKQEVANVADSNNKNKNKTKNKSDNYIKDLYQQIADEWNSIFENELSLVSKVTQKRKSAINGCIAEMKSTQHDFSKIELWSKLFNHAKLSDFLMGRKTDWSMSFDFITTKSKLLKIVEGEYDN